MLIVGGGPVGLFTGIVSKLNNPGLNIKILEKRAEYVRDHNLLLQTSSFKEALRYPAFYDFFKKEVLNNPAKLPRKFSISIQEIEKKLKEFSQRQGIEFEIVPKGIQSEEDLRPFLSENPENDFVVFADGAHSKGRDEIVGNLLCKKKSKKITKRNTEFAKMVTLKLDWEDDISINKMTLLKLYELLKAAGNHFFVELKNNKVSFMFFVKKNIYEKLGNVSFSNQIKCSQDDIANMNNDLLNKLGDILYQDIKKVIGFIVKKGDLRFPDNVKISKNVIGAYIAPKITGKLGCGATFAIVGDAACGLPYRKSANVGLKCAGALGSLDKEKSITKYALFRYSFKVRMNFYSRYVASLLKTLVIKLMHCYIRISSKVFWQVYKLSEKEIKALYSSLHNKKSKDNNNNNIVDEAQIPKNELEEHSYEVNEADVSMSDDSVCKEYENHNVLGNASENLSSSNCKQKSCGNDSQEERINADPSDVKDEHNNSESETLVSNLDVQLSGKLPLIRCA